MTEDYYTRGEKEFLLKIARLTLEKYLREGEKFEPQTVNQKLWEKRGVLVVLKKDNELIGEASKADSAESLILAVRDSTVAATHDPHFPPLEKEELKEIEIEITISGDASQEDNIVFGEGRI